MTIAVFDLDGDGTKEIIAHNDNNNAYVFSASGKLIAELETPHSDSWAARELAGISVGDVSGNGVKDLVITNSAGYLTAFEARPTGGDPKIEFHQLWQRFMDPHKEDPDYQENHPWVNWNGQPGLDGSAYLADVTGDGRDEIFLQLDDMPSLYALNGNGEVTWWNSWSDGNANPIATDFTGNGRIEVMYPSDGGRIFMFDAATNQYHCSLNVRDYGVMPASISVAPTVVDLTGDGRKESVFGARHAIEDKNNDEWYKEMNAHFFAVTADCEVLWHQSWDWGNPHSHMHPIPVDVNGDGRLDIVFQDWNTVGHKPGNWQVTGKPNLFAVDGATGELIWRVETTGYWSNDNIALADITGDGVQELLVVAEKGGTDGIMRYSLQGVEKGFTPSPSGWFINKGPSVADLNGDGKMQMIVPIAKGSDHCTRTLDVGCREGALQIYSTAGSTDPLWPNVKMYNNAYDDKGMPTQTQPVETPPKDPSENESDPSDGKPGAPTSMDAVRSGKDVDLVWKAPEGQTEVSGFTVYRSENEGGPFESITQTSSGTHEWVDKEVPDDRSWYYKVAAYNDAGEGEPSKVAVVERPEKKEADGASDGGGAAPSPSGGGDSEDSNGPSDVQAGGEDGTIRITFSGNLGSGDQVDPMGPLVAQVHGSATSVVMLLDDQEVPVDFENGTASHSPQAPLAPGDHTLTVVATGENGEEVSESVDFSVHEEPTQEAPPSEEPTLPRDGQEDHQDDEPANTPVGFVVGLLAVTLAALGIARWRRASRA